MAYAAMQRGLRHSGSRRLGCSTFLCVYYWREDAKQDESTATVTGIAPQAAGLPLEEVRATKRYGCLSAEEAWDDAAGFLADLSVDEPIYASY